MKKSEILEAIESSKGNCTFYTSKNYRIFCEIYSSHMHLFYKNSYYRKFAGEGAHKAAVDVVYELVNDFDAKLNEVLGED